MTSFRSSASGSAAARNSRALAAGPLRRFLLALLLSAAPVAADEPPKWEFPFDNAGGRVYIDVMVCGKGPYPFALDSASPPTTIDSDLAAELGLKVTAAGTVGGAGEGRTALSIVQGVVLEFGGLTLPEKTIPGARLNYRLRAFSGRPVFGLIGNDFVSTHVVRIDYAAKKVSVWDPEGWEYTGDGTIVRASSGAYVYVRGTVVPVAEPGQVAPPLPARFVLDTGAGVTASLNTHFVDRHHLLHMPTPMLEATIGYGLGGEVRHHVARVHRLTLGAASVERPVVTLSQDERGALAVRAFDGVIGGEILSRFTVIFDLRRGRVIFEPRDSLEDPFEFDMSGLVLETANAPREGEEFSRRLRIMRVEPGTPAAEAGVRVGDEVVSIDGEPLDITQKDRARALLKGDGQQRTLRLLRGGETIEITLRLRRLAMAPPGFEPGTKRL